MGTRLWIADLHFTVGTAITSCGTLPRMGDILCSYAEKQGKNRGTQQVARLNAYWILMLDCQNNSTLPYLVCNTEL
jgi:hypothetical protein